MPHTLITGDIWTPQNPWLLTLLCSLCCMNVALIPRVCVCVYAAVQEGIPLGTIQLAAIIAAPICLLCLAFMTVIIILQRRRHNKDHSPIIVDQAEVGQLIPPDGQTLKDLLEFSHSGSGSGVCGVGAVHTPHLFHNQTLHCGIP